MSQPLIETGVTKQMETEEEAASCRMIPCNRIRRYKHQPRRHFDEKDMRDLEDSIREVGVVNAIKVKAVKDDPLYDYELVDGERRWRASQTVGVPLIKAIIEQGALTEDEFQQFVVSVASNFGSVAHPVLEKAEAMKRLKDGGKTVEQIARICTCSPGSVYQHLGLLRLHPEVQALMSHEQPRSRRLNFTMAMSMVILPLDLQVEFATMVTTHKMSIAKARHWMRQKALSHGHRIGSLSHTPTKDWQKFSTFITNLADVLPTYIDMPGRTIAELTVAQTLTKVEKIDQLLKQIQVDITTAREEIVAVVRQKRERTGQRRIA